MIDLTENQKQEIQEMSEFEINRHFLLACRLNELEKIDYLLTSSILINNSHIIENFASGLKIACSSGFLELVSYLLTSSHLEKYADIHLDNDQCIIGACRYGHLKVVNYLLTSPELKEYADIHADSDRAFKWACTGKKQEIIDYLIFEYKIKKTPTIEKYINTYAIEVIKLFDKREMYEILQQLPEHTLIKKVKI